VALEASACIPVCEKSSCVKFTPHCKRHGVHCNPIHRGHA
jgi:hypothetical protein